MADTPSPHPRLSWRIGLVSALIAPLFLVLIGNLDGFAQAVRRLTELSNSRFESAIPGLQTAVRAGSGLWQVLTTDMPWPGYNFWDPSRVIPYTINEFPYWSFLYADLHPHLIGIPFSLLFLGLVLTLLHSYDLEWRRHRPRAALLFGDFALLLGTLASVNLWELPTYFGLGVLALAVSQYRGRGRIDWPLMLGFALLYPVGAYLLFLPFFRHYVNVGAGGVGLVREPDALGRWLLIWGFFAFVLVSWLLHTGSRPARAGDAVPNGLERWLSLVLGRFESLPGLLHWQGLLVRRPGFGFLAGITLVPLSLVAALGAWLWDRTVLALCLPFLGLAALLLWRRGRTADAGNLFAVLLTATGFAILAGTQLIYLKDFLQGGEWYRMNTLFKFFIQVWVLWGVAAAVAVPRLIGGHRAKIAGVGRYAWHTFFALLLAASFAYPIWGTPVRLDQRFPGWRPGFGTLNGMDFMRQGAYTWPNDQNTVQLAYDWAAIRWLLENVRGNAAILETAQLDYYRAGATRVASLTGLSGLSGMHQSEQRYGQDLGERNGLMQELWSTSDVERTRQLLDEFDVALIYVGQLERHEHPAGVDKLTRMAETGMLTPLYQNERVTIYTVPGRLVKGADGHYYPAQP